MSKAGWYPDPGGQQGMFRYWDGSAWSAVVSPNPNVAPPSRGLGTPPQSGQPHADRGQQHPGTANAASQNQSNQNQYQQGPYVPGQYQPGQRAGYPSGTAPKKRGVAAWWIAAAAVLLVVVVIGAMFIRSAVNSTKDTGQNPGGTSTRGICPREATPESPKPHAADGRVHGGQLSYPMLGAPWGRPITDTRVPFGRDVSSQAVTVEANYQPGQSWVASVLVAELMAGDGFFSPQQGSEIVVKCIVGAFYGDAQVTRDDKVSKAMTVGGKEAWLVESHLTFDIKGLRTKGETAIVLIVRTSDTSASLYYASIPDTSPQYMQPARDAMAQLRVES